jgi:hypothetical protein
MQQQGSRACYSSSIYLLLEVALRVLCSTLRRRLGVNTPPRDRLA